MPSTQLDVTHEAAIKILFLSTDPVHVNHDDIASNECPTCRLISKYEAAFNKKKLSSLNAAINNKLEHLLKIETDSESEFFTLERNLDSINSQLPKEHEALMTFCEVLDIMNVKIPDDLKEKRNAIFKIHRIPTGKKQKDSSRGADAAVEKKSEFFAYTTNKILSELCDSLTVGHVYAMRRTIIKAGSQEGLSKLVEAMENLDVQDEDSKFKDLLFYYIVLNLQKYNFLTRLHNHILKKFIEDSKPDDMDAEQEKVLSKSLKGLDRYPMTPKPPGVCIIFAMKEEREKGTDKDVQNLKELFEGFFNYDVYVKINPSKEKIKEYATELKSARYMFYDSLISIFLAHGNESYLRVKGGKHIHRRDEFITLFSEIGWLQKKPKLFFIQACSDRETKQAKNEIGKKTTTDSIGHEITTDPTWNRTYGRYCDGEINPLADTLVSYATMVYKKSARDDSGSLYINTLIQTLREYGKTKSIESNLRQMHYKVNPVCLKTTLKEDGLKKTEFWKQTPYFESSLEKKFIFPE